MVYDTNTRITFEDEMRMQKNMTGDIIRGKGDDNLVSLKLNTVGQNSMRDVYDRCLNSTPDAVILIRPNGSWMVLTDNHTIISETYRDDAIFPPDHATYILVCENDPEPEQWWISHLKDQWPKLQITTLFNFYDRSQSEIDSYVQSSTIITFTTTMSTIGWFEKLICALSKCKNKLLYWHCKDDTIWDRVLCDHQHILNNHTLNIIKI